MNETKETENDDDGVDTNHDTDHVQEAERNEGDVNEDGNNEESDDEDVSNCSDKEESQLNVLRKKFNSKREQV